MGSRGVALGNSQTPEGHFLAASSVWNKATNPVHCGGAGIPTSFPSDLAWSGPETLNWGAQPLSLAVLVQDGPYQVSLSGKDGGLWCRLEKCVLSLQRTPSVRKQPSL